MIIYGRRSFNAKSVKLSEIGITTDVPGVVQFEYRQQYAHIYWIPMFPLGAEWCVRKTDDKLYELSSQELIPVLNAVPRPKLGWVTFLGPILGISWLLLFSIMSR
jgi:hypothetical protein